MSNIHIEMLVSNVRIGYTYWSIYFRIFVPDHLCRGESTNHIKLETKEQNYPKVRFIS